jgi:hypothetical protein
MSELLVQKYLRSGKSLEDLKLDHGLKINIKDHKIGFNYHQLNSSESDPLACQCRGLILHKDTYEIIAYPMDRFFSYGQFVHNINLLDYKILEKLDGSCCIVYFDKYINKWCLGTRNSVEGDAEVNSGYSIAKIFDNTIKVLSNSQINNLNDLMRNQPIDHTYVFELCTLLNRVVCSYEQPKIALLAVRDNLSLGEKDPKEFNIEYTEYPKEYSFSSITQLCNIVNSFNPFDQEGVVLINNFFRLKLKSSAYTTFNKLHDKLDCSSMRNTLRLILSEQDDDVFPMLDLYNQKKLTWLKDLFNKMVKDVQNEYNKYSHIETNKELASLISKHPYRIVFFNLRKGKDLMSSIVQKDTFGNITDSTVDNILNYISNIEKDLENKNLEQNYNQ